MRAVVTRVISADVTIDNECVGKIGKGFLILLGVRKDDTETNAWKIADKICGLRVFSDENGKMNLSPSAVQAEFLIVSQFTLYADTSSRRPGFTDAASGEVANTLYEKVVELCREKGFHTETGRFGADMKVTSVNDGPITIILEY